MTRAKRRSGGSWCFRREWQYEITGCYSEPKIGQVFDCAVQVCLKRSVDASAPPRDAQSPPLLRRCATGPGRQPFDAATSQGALSLGARIQYSSAADVRDGREEKADKETDKSSYMYYKYHTCAVLCHFGAAAVGECTSLRQLVAAAKMRDSLRMYRTLLSSSTRPSRGF